MDADGRFLSYQWVRNGIPIPGETSPRLNLKEADLSKNSSEYSVRISNDFGMIESTQARLTVNKTLKSWSKNLMDPNNFEIKDISGISSSVVDNDGNIAMTILESTLLKDGGYARRTMSFMKLDPNGNLITKEKLIQNILSLGEKHFILNCKDKGYFILLTNGYYVSDTLSGSVYPPEDILELIRLDKDGKKIWSKILPTGGVIINDFISTKDGNYLISTASNHEGYRFKSHYKSRGSWDSYDYWVFKIDQDGNKIWDRTFQANGEDA